MSGAEITVDPPTGKRAVSTEHVETAWQRWERRFEQIAEHCNPILVKETRQALKSRQFAVTFLIVLIGCWIVSFGVIAVIGPEIRYAAAGADLFLWYYGILSGALCVVVPFSAFRSLAAEQEDNTYDLLSITTLSSTQIVSGKLASAVVQMAIYLSATAPFMAFTFLLRGIDAISVMLMLVAAIAVSIGLSAIGLLVGTISQVRHTQVILSVAFVLGLVFSCWGMVVGAYEFLQSSQYLLREGDFWVAVAVIATVYFTTFFLVHAAAAAQIAFASENRSTPLRRRMMVQQAAFCGWLAAPFFLYPQERPQWAQIGGIFGMSVAAGYWFLMGSLMTGEWPHLSRRVQRSLPQSQPGRIFFTWFNPGPGSGYLFAVANLTAFSLLAALVYLVCGGVAAPGGPSGRAFFSYVLLAWAYVVGFLGIGRMLILTLRRVTYVPMAAAFLLNVILVLAGIGVPIIIDALSPGNRFAGGYTLKHLTNPFWTLMELVDSGLSAIEGPTPVILLVAVALAALMLNLRSVASEVQRQRIAAPTRVLEDEALLRQEPERGPQSPWETDDVADGSVSS